MQVANTWRTTQDISLAIQATWGTVMDNLDGTTALARFAGPGAWNDADMLEVHTTIPLSPHCQNQKAALCPDCGIWPAEALLLLLLLPGRQSIRQCHLPLSMPILMLAGGMARWGAAQ
jgi:hypothetical protein